MEAPGGTHVITVIAVAVIIRLGLADRIAPRKVLGNQTTPRRLFPLRLARQAVAVGTPVADGGIARSRPIDRTGDRVTWRQPLLLAPRVAPLHHVIPGQIGRASCRERV